MRIVLWALLVASAWTAALATIARSPGLHSTPGMWAYVFGLPGVAFANWIQSSLGRRFDRYLAYSIMLLVNWGFYCTVILGLVSVKRSVWE